MVVGTVKEIKTWENRVGITPAGAQALVAAGHKVLVEKNAGFGSGFSDDEYKKAGATIIPEASDVYKKAEMIIKVKEPQENEYKYYREGLILYTYLHLAAEKSLTEMLMKKKVIGIAYETIELNDGSLPLLTPMSEVAGRMAVQIGAFYLQKPNGGEGVLLGGVPGVLPANTVIFGTGVVGINALKMAMGLGSNVTIFGRSLQALRNIDDLYFGKVKTQLSNPANVEKALIQADLVISGVLITGEKAPKVVTRKMLGKMKKGSVMVDVSIDQGGSFETSKPTSHKDPTYEVDGIVHYCVTNMPGAVPRTSTLALTNATLKYALDLANKGFEKAIHDDEALAKGVNTINGKCTYKGVADAFKIKYTPLADVA